MGVDDVGRLSPIALVATTETMYDVDGVRSSSSHRGAGRRASGAARPGGDRDLQDRRTAVTARAPHLAVSVPTAGGDLKGGRWAGTVAGPSPLSAAAAFAGEYVKADAAVSAHAPIKRTQSSSEHVEAPCRPNRDPTPRLERTWIARAAGHGESDAALRRGARHGAVGSLIREIVIDCVDPSTVSAFWGRVLEWEVRREGSYFWMTASGADETSGSGTGVRPRT